MKFNNEMNSKILRIFLIPIFLAINIGCKKNNFDFEIFLCSSDHPLSAQNVYKLDQNSGILFFPNVFTPNQDGLNDAYFIPNINLYPNYLITISDLNDTIVYDSEENGPFFDGKNKNTGEELKYGSYQYKVVIENEQTFLQYGYLSIIRNKSERHGFNFSNCLTTQTSISEDPVLSE